MPIKIPMYHWTRLKKRTVFQRVILKMPLKSQVPSQSPKVTRATSAAACSPCCHLATDMNVSTATATGPRAALSQAVKRLRSCSTFQLQIVLFFMPLW